MAAQQKDFPFRKRASIPEGVTDNEFTGIMMRAAEDAATEATTQLRKARQHTARAQRLKYLTVALEGFELGRTVLREEISRLMPAKKVSA